MGLPGFLRSSATAAVTTAIAAVTGLLARMTKLVVESALEGEMDDTKPKQLRFYLCSAAG
jgi:hypothetical protein